MTETLATWIDRHPRLVVLTGAGCSLASGIPTYRDQSGAWRRSRPIQHRDFLNHHSARQRYWARSFSGWPVIAGAQPNAAHRALQWLEAAGHIDLLVTQNIDGLHRRAGSRSLIELHGDLATVECLGCGQCSPRWRMQQRLAAANPHLAGTGMPAPDGDADVPDAMAESIQVPSCEVCEGILKPAVVFFGDSVPRNRVQQVERKLTLADGLLVVGSSLMVFSGYRFVRHGHQLGLALACVNPGSTRADGLFDLKIEEDCGQVLDAMVAELTAFGRKPGSG